MFEQSCKWITNFFVLKFLVPIQKFITENNSLFSARVRSLVSILVVLCILTGYSIMTASFAIYEVQEHQTGSKRLQHISGIGEPMYWIINFLYDMVSSQYTTENPIHLIFTQWYFLKTYCSSVYLYNGSFPDGFWL